MTSTEYFKGYADETPTVCSAENAKAVAFERMYKRLVGKVEKFCLVIQNGESIFEKQNIQLR